MRQQPNFKHYTRGGQISFHNLRMWDQITKTLVMICFLPGVVSSLPVCDGGIPELAEVFFVFFSRKMLNTILNSMIRIAPEITSYSWKIYAHPDMGIAL